MTWSGGLDDAQVTEVRAVAAAATEADGTAPLSEHVLVHLRGAGHPAVAQLLGRDADGRLVAFAHLDVEPGGTGVGEFAVHPAHRRVGIGGQVVEALLDRTGLDAAGLDAAGPAPAGRLRLWAHGKHPGAVALAQRYGFTPTRELWQMRRSLLAPLPAPEFGPGVRVRPFVVGADEAEFLRVNNAAFDWHPEQGGWDTAQVQLREAEPWFDPAGFLLAVDADDRLLGFHWTKVHAGHPPIGEVYVLGVDPAARGRRLGAALTLAGLLHLRDRGLGEVMLYVEADNAAAIRVYSDLGFRRWDTDVSYLR